MAELKVGDKVRVLHSDGCPSYYRPGAEGVVACVEFDLIQVRFVSGEYDTDNDGKWWVYSSNLELVVPYSRTFTKPAAAEPTTGHVEGSGLQKHSVGDLYPLAVVGYARDSEHTMWVVENLETGEVACGYADAVWQWPVHALAAKFAEHCKYAAEFAYQGVPIWWVKGRPHFPISHLLSMNTARG